MSTPEQLDKTFVWHPFTPNDTWLDPDFRPLFIASGQGSTLRDENGREYLDGNSSIWTNLHGHNHPDLNRALITQLQKIAHSSYLGLAHVPGAELAEKLAQLLATQERAYRVFFSDDGSTAMEAALKIAYQFFQQNGQPQRIRFVSLSQGYHGDTVGAMSLGQSPTFHGAYQQLLFPTLNVMAPACYRCPYNRATPTCADARTTRQCDWECVEELERVFAEHGAEIAALVIEPRVQGAAGMLMHPPGYLARAAEIARKHGALLIVDEVLTGLGRTGAVLAVDLETVKPDLLALAKGLTGGYLPMAATLVRATLFAGFGGGPERTFFHGHSFTGNQLGCALALENLAIFEREKTLGKIALLSLHLKEKSARFWEHPNVGDIRQEGLILAIELVQDRATRLPFPTEAQLAARINSAAQSHGLLARGRGHTLFLIPPYCTTPLQLEDMLEALWQGLLTVLPLS